MSEVYDSLSGISEAAAAGSATLIRDAEQEYTSRPRTGAQREAFASLVNGQDRLRQDAEAIEALEDVYTGDEDPAEGVTNLPGNSGIRVGSNCESGYQEFPIDDETSSCVFQSLVEENCYAGSRRVHEPDLGDADACLYYSLDFFQRGGTCRENYARVQYQGRETCRWAALGPNQPPWYTLHKEEEEGGELDGCVTVTFIEYPLNCGGEGNTRYAPQFTNSCSFGVGGRYSFRTPEFWADKTWHTNAGGTHTSTAVDSSRCTMSRPPFRYCIAATNLIVDRCYSFNPRWIYQ